MKLDETQNNVEKLASEIVESWDMDTLIAFAIDTLVLQLSGLSEEDFKEEVDNFSPPRRGIKCGILF